MQAFQREQTPETEGPVRQFLTLDATRWQYVTGVPDETLVDPESWYHDYALISRPGNDLVQLKLLRDYATNAPLYPRLHEYFRATHAPLMAVWGRGDEIFGPAGAEAFADDLPDAEIHLLDGGHFLLESALDEVAELIRVFLAKVYPAGDATPKAPAGSVNGLDVPYRRRSRVTWRDGPGRGRTAADPQGARHPRSDRAGRRPADRHRGPSASNMESVRKAASVSGSQLAHYFADKSALIRAVVRRQIGVVLDFHRQPALGGLQSFDDFERWIDLNMRYLRRIGTSGGTPTFHALAAQLAKSDETMRAHAGCRLTGNGFDCWRTAIQRVKDAGSWSPRPIRDAWRWSSSAPTKGVARWPSPTGRNGRTPTPLDSQSTTCACSPPIPPNAIPVRRAGPGAGARPRPQDTSLRFTRKGTGDPGTHHERRGPTDVRAWCRQYQRRRGARAAGVSGSQISHYFRDKRELTRQVIASRRADVGAFHTQPRLGALDSLDALQAWAAACVADIDAVYRRGLHLWLPGR